MRYLFSFFFPSLISLVFFVAPLAKATSEPKLRDKIGQMLLVGFDGKTLSNQHSILKSIEQDNIGGVILFDKNIEDPQQVQQLNHALQNATRQANLKHHRPKLPLLISVDYEGGKVARLSEKHGFPATLSAAEIGKRSFAEAEISAESMAQILKQSEFNLDFAPVLDVNVNPDNPVISKKERSFSSDAKVVASYASIFSRHFLNQKTQCAYKHFPGHGSSTTDSHLGFVDVTDTWKTDELQPYQELLNKSQSCSMVMTAHIVNRQLDVSGLPATLSHRIITDLLRKQLQFKGVIITDDMQMKAISDNYGLEQALVLAINAGTDMLIYGNNLEVSPQDPSQLIDIIEAKVISGDISAERINDAYQHILTLKHTLNDSGHSSRNQTNNESQKYA